MHEAIVNGDGLLCIQIFVRKSLSHQKPEQSFTSLPGITKYYEQQQRAFANVVIK